MQDAGRLPPRALAAAWLRRNWRPVALGGLFVVLFLSQIVYLVSVVWEDEKYSYGYLIPVVSAFFLWANRERIAALPRRPANLGVAGVAAGVLIWIYAQGVGFNALAHLAMLLVVASLVVAAGGWRFLWTLAFPVFYLVFMFPVPKRLDDIYVVQPLQRFASRISEHAIDLLGIPVFRQGNVLEVPGMKLLVEEACSGIHSLYALAALGTAFVFLADRRWWEKLVLILATVPIAIAANVFRVSFTGILATTVSTKAAQGFFHEFSGLLIFLLGLGLFLLLAWLLRVWFPVPEEDEGLPAAADA